MIDIFYPIAEVLYRTTPYIGSEVGFRFQHLAKIEEIVGAEAVVFSYTSPPSIDDGGPFGFRSNTVFPLISIGKTTTRPAQVRNSERT